MKFKSAFGLTLLTLALTILAFSGRGFAAPTIELTIWDQEREDIEKAFNEQFTKFTQANPTIKIKTAHYATEDLKTQFQTAAMGGGGADIVLAPNDFGGPFSVMGIIQPVQTWAKMERFAPAASQAVTDTQGRSWGVPISRGNHLILFANGNLVNKAPETIEDLIVVAKKHTEAKQGRFGLAYNLNEPFWFITFLGAFGQRPLIDQKPQLGNDSMIQALRLVRKLKFEDKVVPADCDYACADTLFTEGKAAMIINGDWAIQQYREKFKDKLVIAPLPKLAATGKYMMPMVSGKYLFLNKKLSGEKLEAAKRLTEFLVSKATQEALIKSTQRLPSTNELVGADLVAKDPVLAATEKALAHGQPMPLDVEMRVVWDAIRPQLQNIMAGRSDAKVAAAAIQKDAETKIRDMKN